MPKQLTLKDFLFELECFVGWKKDMTIDTKGQERLIKLLKTTLEKLKE